MAMKAEVEADLFSGRPNPTWELSSEEAAALTEKLSALPPASPRELFSGLGYRGLRVRLRGDTGAQTLCLQKGVVQVERGGRTTFLEDRGRALERWLARTGRPFLGEDLARLLEAELGR